jgi:hypothetical protein
VILTSASRTGDAPFLTKAYKVIKVEGENSSESADVHAVAVKDSTEGPLEYDCTVKVSVVSVSSDDAMSMT